MSDERAVSAVPMITHALPGVGGNYRTRLSDFFVEELPGYALGDKGTHAFFLMEKTGLTTAEALRSVAQALGKRDRDIGYAGLKDAYAVTRQWISIEHIDPDRVMRLRLEHIRFLAMGRHDNKLKMGHLKGNRFRIRLRSLCCPMAQAEARTQAILSVLSERGMPNAFGPQRFGNRANGHLLGRAVLLNQREVFLDLLMGDPRSDDSPNEFRVRTLYSQGQFAKALKVCPGNLMDSRRILRALVKNRGEKHKAFNFVSPGLTRFLVTAYQSYLFNQVLSARMPQIDRLLAGDIAYSHSNGGCFRVGDPVLEQDRCTRFEISPSGPIYSLSMTRPESDAGRIENAVLAKEEVSLLAQSVYMKKNVARGARRPLRVRPTTTSISRGQCGSGPYLELKFDLPAGSYATILLREIMK
ncbi:MAG: tRNA pseudouridine(13) synthase TruD [Phycisphaerae bacterium]|nr:tRNA pseudouridine(13) synthase TruD [Phycisphaerae bacterium]